MATGARNRLLTLSFLPARFPAGLLTRSPARFPARSPVLLPVLLLVLSLSPSRGLAARTKAGAAPDTSAAAARALHQDVRVWSEHHAVRIEASDLLPCTLEQAWAVILDYAHIPVYQALLDTTWVLSQEGDRTMVHQEGSGTFIITKRLKCDMEYRRIDPQTVTFRSIKGDFDRFDGTWLVAAESAGVRVHFSSAIKLSLPFPGFLLRRIMYRHTVAMMPALAAEIARRFPRG